MSVSVFEIEKCLNDAFIDDPRNKFEAKCIEAYVFSKVDPIRKEIEESALGCCDRNNPDQRLLVQPQR